MDSVLFCKKFQKQRNKCPTSLHTVHHTAQCTQCTCYHSVSPLSLCKQSSLPSLFCRRQLSSCWVIPPPNRVACIYGGVSSSRRRTYLLHHFSIKLSQLLNFIYRPGIDYKQNKIVTKWLTDSWLQILWSTPIYKRKLNQLYLKTRLGSALIADPSQCNSTKTLN